MGTDAGPTAEHPVKATPKRRWLQYSLRTLLALILVFSCGLGWFAREVQRARAQRKAAAAIEKSGGRVQWGPPSGGMIRTAVAGVGKLFGEDLSGDVTGVWFGGPQVTDAGL